MALDLTLLPFSGESSADTALPLERRSALFQIIRLELPAEEALHNFESYLGTRPDGSQGHGLTLETSWGYRVKYVTAGALAALSGHPEVMEHWLNRAAWAYVRELPPETKVALFWR